MKVLDRFSLFQQMLAGGVFILLVGMFLVGTWVAGEIESGVISRAGLVTGLYVDSFIEPRLQSLAGGGPVPDVERDGLDRLLTTTPLGQEITLIKIWSRDGRVMYSNDRALVEQRFPATPMLTAAFAGQGHSHITELDDLEHKVERQRWHRLIETYVPVHRAGSAEVIAVAEFYQQSDTLIQQIGAARLRSWFMVGGATLVMSALLGGLVRRASNTIIAQQRELHEKVTQLTETLAQNERLRERVQRAGARTTALNEEFLHRVAADIHDGPSQGVALALMRLEPMMELCTAPGAGASQQRTLGDEFRTVQSALQCALDDLRAISKGLHLPEIEQLSVSEIARRAVRDYERKVGVGPAVSMDVEDVPNEVPLPVKITLFRLLQESLANGFRHGGAVRQRISLKAREGELLIEVADDGHGFDPHSAGAEGHLGIAGMRERVVILGGTFSVQSAPNRGTVIKATLPMTALELAHE